MSTLQRELCGKVTAIQTYEHCNIGSPFPMYLYCDHKPTLHLWGRKGQLSRRFFKYQVIITKFHNLRIIWPPGSNLAFPDILSRNTTLSEAKRLQLFNIKRFHTIYHSMIRTVTKFTTPSSTKMNRTHLITTSTPSSAS